MDILLTVVLNPGLGILGWILVGLLAGALAGRLSRGKGFGCLGDTVIGLVGAIVGGWVVNAVATGPRVFHFIGTLFVALLGALIMIFGLRLIRRLL